MGVGEGQCCSCQEGEGGQSGERVVLLACGEGEEADDDGDPEDEGESGFVFGGEPMSQKRDMGHRICDGEKRVAAAGRNVAQGMAQMRNMSQKSQTGVWP